jgi:tetratricopeptide (TPR) repeat protein
LYEMLTGAKPFKGTATAELFASILRDRLAPLPVDVPGLLRGLVERCLEKDPNARYQRAADVRFVLEAVAVLQRGRPKSDPHIAAGGALPPAPMLNTVGDPGGFVGRENELALMLNVWTRATGGKRQLIFLAGEPGIGKTRLALEFGHRRDSEGATVLAGRSDEEALVPYQPFVEALNWYARVCPEPELRAQLAAIGGGAELGQMLPELMRRITDLPILQPMNAEGQRYHLFEAVTALLAQASASRPMVIILDDLHWADKPTLLMLRHVVRSSDVANFCVVGTYRESELARTHPLAEMLVDLRREQMVTRISLRGLDGPETQVLVNTLAGPDVSPRLASLVMESTDGNPFFIAEMLKHLSETGALARLRGASAFGASDLGLPEGIKEVIGRRLSRLSEECNRILSLAAVIGRDFNVDLLLKLADLAEDRILDAIDEAVQARLISEVPGRPQRFTFLHALIRETLYGELISTRRVRLHLRVGEAIEQLAEGSPTPPLADLAYHFAQAAPAGAADKAIDYATRAGDRAADAVALEEAARLYDIALQLLEFKTAGPEAERRYVDLHERRARAFGALGQWTLQKREVEAALRYLNAEQVDRRAALCLELAEASMFLMDISSVEKSATEALNLSEQVDRSDIAADAIAWLARARQATGDLTQAIELDRSAIAKGKGTKRVALTYGLLSLYLAGETTEALARATEAAEFARSSRDAGSVMYSLAHCGLSLGAAGRYDEAAKVFEEVRQFGKKYGVVPLLARATSMSVAFHLNVFDFEGAEALVSEARELAASVNFDPTLVSASIDLIFIHARRQEPERADRLLRETATRMENIVGGWHEWLWKLRMTQARAELALARGDFEAAIVESGHGSALSRSKRRPKYEALGLITAAHALNGLGRTHQAIEKARSAITVARPTADPALLLQAADALLALDGNDPLADEARGLTSRILAALPDETMRSRFTNSEVAQRIRRL